MHIADYKQNFSAFVEWKEELVSIYSSSFGGPTIHCFIVSKAHLKVIIIRQWQRPLHHHRKLLHSIFTICYNTGLTEHKWFMVHKAAYSEYDLKDDLDKAQSNWSSCTTILYIHGRKRWWLVSRDYLGICMEGLRTSTNKRIYEDSWFLDYATNRMSLNIQQKFQTLHQNIQF
jgi:hypothetical protein